MKTFLEELNGDVFNDKEFLTQISDPQQELTYLNEIRTLLQDQYRFRKLTHPEIYERLKDECQSPRIRSALSFVLFSHFADVKDIAKANEYLSDAHDFITYEYKLSEELKKHSYHLYKVGSTSYILTIVGMARVLKILKYQYLNNETITRETKNYKNRFKTTPSFVPNIQECTEYYIEMDFIDGYTLAEYREKILWQSSDLLVPRTKIIITKLCKHLQILATNNNLHCDLTPENIIIKETNANHLEVYLIDFGYNYVLTQRVGSNIEFISAQKYIAPEVIDDVKNATTKSDCYSIGLMLLEILFCQSLNIINLDKALENVRQEFKGLANLIESMIEQDAKTRLKEFIVPSNIKLEEQGRIYTPIIDAIDLHFTLYDKIYQESQDRSIISSKKSIIASLFKTISDFLLTDISKIGKFIKEISELKLKKYKDLKSQMQDALFWALLCQICHIIILVCFIWKVKQSTVGLDGRLVALAFSFVATKYYMNIYSGLWVSDISKITQWGIRWTSFFFIFPILYLILINPDHWPYASSLGATAIPVNNFLTYRLISKGIRESMDLRQQDVQNLLSARVDADRILFKDDYISWGLVTIIFFPALALLGYLLDINILHDKIAYAIITLALISKMYVFNCTLSATYIRTGLEREISIAKKNRIPPASW